MVAAAVLCLTPIWAYYKGIGMPIMLWPLALSLPMYIMLLPVSLEGFFYMILPLGTVVGVSTWLAWGRIWGPENQDAEPD